MRRTLVPRPPDADTQRNRPPTANDSSQILPTSPGYGSTFVRRRVEPVKLQQTTTKERCRPALGVGWDDLKRGLQAVLSPRSTPVWTGAGSRGAQVLVGPRQQGLQRCVMALNDHYTRKKMISQMTRSVHILPWSASKVSERPPETQAERSTRLRQVMTRRRHEKEVRAGGVDATGFSALVSTEHASLQLALQREAPGKKKFDNLEKIGQKRLVAGAADAVEPCADASRTDGTGSVTNCIRALNELAQSNFIENQRDVAAALYSLSINDENKPAFIEAEALLTLIKMADAKDPDIRRKIAGSMYHLSMSRRVKRPFVQLGALRPLLAFSVSKDSEIQRYSMYAIKELCGKEFMACMFCVRSSHNCCWSP